MRFRYREGTGRGKGENVDAGTAISDDNDAIIDRRKVLIPLRGDGCDRVLQTHPDRFDIGVWNPALGEHFSPLSDTAGDDIAPATIVGGEGKGEEDDASGLIFNGLHSPGDLSDAEDDEAVVLFDFINRVQERLGSETS